MNNENKINKKIEDIVNNQGFLNMLNIGLFLALGFTKIKTNFKSSSQTNKNLTEILKNSVIDFSEETYRKLETLNTLFDIINSSNRVSELMNYSIVKDPYNKFLIEQVMNDIDNIILKTFNEV